MKRNVYIDNMPLEKALDIFIRRLENCQWFDPQSEEIEVESSLGRISNEPVLAHRSSPHYLASAMDGIAVKAQSTFGALESNPIYLQDYLEVDTGDYVPPEYDAVIMIEDVNFVDSKAQIIKPAVPWQYIRSIGEDLIDQDMIVPSGTRIGPFELASFLTAGVKKIKVLKKPLVAIIPTGSELVKSGDINMAPGLIVDSNSHMLAGLCQEWGAEVIKHDIVADDRDLILQAVKTVKDSADLIVVCSGSSAGREDYTSSIVKEMGELLVHGIAIRPGKPAILGLIDNKPFIGVPGYPVSAQLVFSLFAQPILFRHQASALPAADLLECNLSRKLASPMGVDEFVYVNVAKIGQQIMAYPLNRGAGLSSILVKADGIIHVPRGQEGIEAGASCQVKLTRPLEVTERTLMCLGSHDMALDVLSDIMQRNYNLRLVSTNVGSMGGIMSLGRQETHFAGIHLLDTDSGTYNIPYLKRYLPRQKCLMINLVIREQGLIVKKGNPLHITGIQDLSRAEVRYINRQKGAGTRLLLDYLLSKAGILPEQINGYNREEYTHLAVAAAVKNNACDTGLAIYASARAMDLDFIPIGVENYDLCILPDLMAPENLDHLLEAIQSLEFRQRVQSFGGYSFEISGQIMYRQNY